MKTQDNMDMEIINSPIKLYHNCTEGPTNDHIYVNISRGANGWVHGDIITNWKKFFKDKQFSRGILDRRFADDEPIMFVGIGENFGGYEWPYFLGISQNKVQSIASSDIGILDPAVGKDYVELSKLVSNRNIIVQKEW